MAAAAVQPRPPNVSPTDADVLNFALNLEYLEAQFYLYAATGSGLEASDTTAGSASPYQTVGTVTLGDAAAVPGLTPAQQEILNEIAYEEQEHVRFLRSALGSAAVPMPDIDLSFFGPLAVAATITTAATGAGSFNPFSSFDYFLVGGFIFEDVGVTAYSGAAPLISPAGVAAGYLTAAAGILAVEAYHAGYIRTSLTGRAIAAGSASRISVPGRCQSGGGSACDAHSGRQCSPFNDRVGGDVAHLPPDTQPQILRRVRSSRPARLQRSVSRAP